MSVGIVSRFMNIDLPYMSQWFEYYSVLNINHFYLYYIDNTFFNIEELLNYFPKNKVTIKQITLNSIQDSNSVFYDYPFTIKEEYILHIDSDEYLYLNNENIYTFIQKNKDIDAFYFSWYMCPSNKIMIHNFNDVLKDKNSKKYFINIYKVLFKNKDFYYIKGYTHDITFLNNVTKKYMQNPYFLIHFSYRGIYDCYYKYKYQKLINHNDKDLQSAPSICNINLKSIYLTQIPSRILVYLGEINNKNTHVDINIILPIIKKSQYELYKLFDNTTEEEHNLFIKRIKNLEKYEFYKDILIQTSTIKNYIKNISQHINKNILFDEF